MRVSEVMAKNPSTPFIVPRSKWLLVPDSTPQDLALGCWMAVRRISRSLISPGDCDEDGEAVGILLVEIWTCVCLKLWPRTPVLHLLYLEVNGSWCQTPRSGIGMLDGCEKDIEKSDIAG
jgi:hypothetical protein